MKYQVSELAKLLGISRQAIYQMIENGLRTEDNGALIIDGADLIIFARERMNTVRRHHRSYEKLHDRALRLAEERRDG